MRKEHALYGGIMGVSVAFLSFWMGCYAYYALGNLWEWTKFPIFMTSVVITIGFFIVGVAGLSVWLKLQAEG